MIRRNLLQILLTVLVSAPHAGMAADAAKTKPQDTRAALSKLSGEKKQTSADLAAARTQQSTLQKQLRDVELRTNNTAAALRRTRDNITKMAGDLAALERRFDAQDNALARHKAQIADKLVRRYALERMQRVTVAANADDAATLSRQLHHLDKVTIALTLQADSLAQKTTELQQTREEIRAQQRTLEALRTEQTQQLDELKSHAEEQQRIASSLALLIESKSTHLSTLNEDEKRLKATLQRIARAERAKTAKSPSTGNGLAAIQGQINLPVQGPILRPFGGGATGRSQQGMLIGASSGEEVRAVADGRVVFADWMRGYGMLMIIDHGDQLLSLYGQNESLLKSVGDRVTKGEAIASAGQSGGQTRPGVYFELRHQGKPIDPYLVLRK